MSEADLISIGELANRSGLATPALRYYEEEGLLEPAARIGGRRHYRRSALTVVGIILLLRDLGFRLDEIRGLMAMREAAPSAWRTHAGEKVAELDDRISTLRTAREALAHAVEECESDDIVDCPIFQAVVDARLAGVGLPASTTATSTGSGRPSGRRRATGR